MHRGPQVPIRSGRGELHLSILAEKIRGEGYELALLERLILSLKQLHTISILMYCVR